LIDFHVWKLTMQSQQIIGHAEGDISIGIDLKLYVEDHS
jgi:hypothetical protein